MELELPLTDSIGGPHPRQGDFLEKKEKTDSAIPPWKAYLLKYRELLQN